MHRQYYLETHIFAKLNTGAQIVESLARMLSQTSRVASTFFTKGLGQRTALPSWEGAWRRLFTSQAEVGSCTRASIWGRPPFEASPKFFRANIHRPTRVTNPNVFLGGSRRGFRFSPWSRNGNNPTSTEKPLSLSERLRKMTREYGWTALGVYLALSVLDFPFCFLLVRIVGVETIGKIEHWIVSKTATLIPDSVKDWWKDYWSSVKKAEKKELGDDEITEKVEMVGWGVEQAQERHQEDASIWTQLALAYAIHKSFIFLRIPLTAAVLPKVVKVLRGWGWNIGKRRVK